MIRSVVYITGVMGKLSLVLRALNLEPVALHRLHQARNATIFYLSVPAHMAITSWHVLRTLVPQTGYWPVLIGDDGDVAFLRSHIRGDYRTVNVSPQTMIDEARHIDAEDWFRTQKRPFDTYGEEEWPASVVPAHTFVSPYNMDGTFLPVVNIGLVPTVWSWHVPAFLHFGYHNFSPRPAVHVSVLKHWYKVYGAEVVAMTDNTELELRVLRPPQTRKQAFALAQQQGYYCHDIVGQGTRGKQTSGSLARLAPSLLNGTVWYFWWD